VVVVSPSRVTSFFRQLITASRRCPKKAGKPSDGDVEVDATDRRLRSSW
jgi:hypothetical protein